MRCLGRTGPAAALAVVIALLVAITAQASPGEIRTCARLDFQLDADGEIAQPFDRWLAELADMTALTIDSAVWRDGQAMELCLSVSDIEVVSLAFLAQGKGVSAQSSLMAQGAVTLADEDAREARAVMEGLMPTISKAGQQVLSAAEFSALAASAAVTLDRWGQAAAGTDGETCVAVSDFVEALSIVAARAGDAPWLRVTAQPMETEGVLSVDVGKVPAPDELPALLALEGLWAALRAVAE
jgi:hypothetical protein